MSEKYTYKIGDVIRITNGGLNEGEYFSTGHVATITSVDGDGDFWADFCGHGNDHVHLDGEWCIGNGANDEDEHNEGTMFELVTAVAPEVQE